MRIITVKNGEIFTSDPKTKDVEARVENRPNSGGIASAENGESREAENREVGHRKASKERETKKGRASNEGERFPHRASTQNDDHSKQRELFDSFDLSDTSSEGTGQAQTRKSKRPEKGSLEDIYNRAIYLLAMREHSKCELSDKLKRKFPGSTHIDAAVQRVVEEGFLCDRRFTESFVRSRMGRGSGPQKIQAELRNKGVEETIIQMFLNFEDEQWTESAQTVYRKKFGDTPIEDYQDWAKRARFLQSKGFTRKQLDQVIPSY